MITKRSFLNTKKWAARRARSHQNYFSWK